MKEKPLKKHDKNVDVKKKRFTSLCKKKDKKNPQNKKDGYLKLKN